MDTKDLLHQIRANVKDVQAQGQTVVAVTALDAYLEALEITTPTSQQSSEHALQTRLAEFTARTTASVEGFRAVITSGQNALKSALLINGGAAVALLGFLGAGWSTEVPRMLLAQVPLAMAFFVFGVLAAAMAGGATYISQEMFGSGQQRPGKWVKAVAIGLGIGAYMLFALGAMQAYRAFVSI